MWTTFPRRKIKAPFLDLKKFQDLINYLDGITSIDGFSEIELSYRDGTAYSELKSDELLEKIRKKPSNIQRLLFRHYGKNIKFSFDWSHSDGVFFSISGTDRGSIMAHEEEVLDYLHEDSLNWLLGFGSWYSGIILVIGITTLILFPLTFLLEDQIRTHKDFIFPLFELPYNLIPISLLALLTGLISKQYSFIVIKTEEYNPLVFKKQLKYFLVLLVLEIIIPFSVNILSK